ncbi:MAG TPA: chromate transporter, partial [Pyrinomonadaceae bacterium]|nr:chromate transporter [Pyrinomonadaceae bacterium]
MNRNPRAKQMFRNAREQGQRFGNRVRYGTKRLKRLSREQTLGGIFLSFLKIGITGFGGGLAVMTQVRALAVNKRRWFTDHEFAEAFALAQSLPGTNAGNAVTYIGLRLRGWRGAAVAMAGFILPSMSMMIGLAILYRHLHNLPATQHLFHGLNAAVVALIIVTAWRIGRNTLARPWQWYTAVLAALAVTILSATIIEVVLLAGLVGIYIDSFGERRWYRWRRIRRLSARRHARLLELEQQAYFGGGYLTR